LEEGFLMADSIQKTEPGFTALDIETTGLSPSFCGIVEIAALKVLPGGSARTFQTLVNPLCYIPDAVISIHGITNDMVRGQPSARAVVPSLIEFVGTSPLVLHNAPFDMSFLNPVLEQAGLCWHSPAVFDTLPLSRRAFPGLRSYSLENLSRFFDFDSGGHHRALADCRYCAQLFLRILNKFGAKSLTFEEIVRNYSSSQRLLGR
jgi:DNA polymerase-3 subunit epsilon